MKSYYKSILLALFMTLCGAVGLLAQSKSQVQNQLRHVVVMTFKPGTSNEQMPEVDHSFKNLAKLKMVKGFEWGIGSDDRDTVHVKHVYVTTFASKNDEADYGNSPEH
jgi:hypothetical protein